MTYTRNLSGLTASEGQPTRNFFAAHAILHTVFGIMIKSGPERACWARGFTLGAWNDTKLEPSCKVCVQKFKNGLFHGTQPKGIKADK